MMTVSAIETPSGMEIRHSTVVTTMANKVPVDSTAKIPSPELCKNFGFRLVCFSKPLNFGVESDS